MNIVIFGLSITSSWGNGHATTYRGLVKALAQRGHTITFLECDVEWYRHNRDLETTPYADVALYQSVDEAQQRFGPSVRNADLVILGSFVQDGPVLAEWLTREARGVTAFYDIDTPVTLAALEEGRCAYISRDVIPKFDLYLSFTGGPTLQRIEADYSARRTRPLYCSVDPDIHAAVAVPAQWELGYLGTYSADRQSKVEELLLQTARRLPQKSFVVGGPQYPDTSGWPANVAHISHVPPPDHPAFYCGQRYTLNVTRSDMIAAGYSPSVRLFEAAACGVPIISDDWPGLDTFFTPGKEILLVRSSDDVTAILNEIPEERRLEIAAAARRRTMGAHTAEHRARELETYVRECQDSSRASTAATTYA